MATIRYKRILLKLSGQVLDDKPVDNSSGTMMEFLAGEISAVLNDAEVALVVGGGNFFRGISKDQAGIRDRVTADHIGMLATIMNALMLKDVFETNSIRTTVMSAIDVGNIAEKFDKSRACNELAKGNVVIFTGGTGNPYFSTDTAAALRALEIDADVLIKGSKVDGIYDKDPAINKDARRIDRLSYEEAIKKDIRVMDQTSFSLLKDHGIPIIVYRMSEPGALSKVLSGLEGSIVLSE